MKQWLLIAEIFFLLVSFPVPVRADRDEWRVSSSASAIAASVTVGGSTGEPLAAGLGLRVAFGFSNAIEVGGRASSAWMPLATFHGATVDGDDGDLYAELFIPSLAIEARWQAGVELSRALYRTHPLVGLRAGLMGLWLRDRLVVDPESGLEVDRYADALRVKPFAGLDAGVEHRFARNLTGGLVATVDVARGYRALGLTMELSWLFY